jgi:hypothetical protein
MSKWMNAPQGTFFDLAESSQGNLRCSQGTSAQAQGQAQGTQAYRFPDTSVRYGYVTDTSYDSGTF